MQYEKIVFLPTGNKDRANEILKDLVFHYPALLFIVFGDDSDADEILSIASDLAEKPGYNNFHIVSIDKPSVIKGVLNDLNDTDNQLGTLSKVRAFSLSITDKIMDVIKTDEDNVGLLRIWKSFKAAYND